MEKCYQDINQFLISNLAKGIIKLCLKTFIALKLELTSEEWAFCKLAFIVCTLDAEPTLQSGIKFLKQFASIKADEWPLWA